MKYKFYLKNLDCANCARKIEEHLQKEDILDNVVVNFSRLTLTFTSKEKNIKSFVVKKVKEVEPEVIVIEKDEESGNEITFDIIKLIIGILFTILGIINKNLSFGFFIIAYVILLYEICIKAIKLLFKSLTIDEHLLITISCIGAYFTDNVVEGLMVIILYNIGEVLEHIAVNNTRKSITDLMDIKQDYANLKRNDEIVKVDPDTIKIGDTIVVKKGEKIPLDGIVIKGHTSLNTVALTGESKLRDVKEKDEVLSGSINTLDIIEVKVTKKYEDGTVARILDLVENATDRKAKTENFVARAAKIYTPIVIILAILVATLLPVLFDVSYNESIYRALSFLVISCPCAIVISVPLSYFAGIGVSSKKGILIKGSDYLDGLKDVNKIVFDKTGTLTTGEFTNFNLVMLNDKYNDKEIIKWVVKGEMLSNHPLAKSIVNNYNVKVNTKDVEDFKELTGKGISFKIDGNKFLVGSASLVNSDTKDSSIYIKINKDIVAKLELTDMIKKNAKETIIGLKRNNIETFMFTGDSKDIALNISNELKIDNTKYELLPEEKYKLLEDLIKDNKDGKVAFVGDGINDAPSLALSDIGISMGIVGSASATQASDIVLVNDDIKKILDAINISKRTNRIIKENLLFALLVKVVVLVLAALGISSMWHAVFADTGVTLLTIINTMRILRRK